MQMEVLLEAKGIGSPEAEIPGYVSCLIWVLGTEPMSFSCGAVSPAFEGALRKESQISFDLGGGLHGKGVRDGT